MLPFLQIAKIFHQLGGYRMSLRSQFPQNGLYYKMFSKPPTKKGNPLLQNAPVILNKAKQDGTPFAIKCILFCVCRASSKNVFFPTSLCGVLVFGCALPSAPPASCLPPPSRTHTQLSNTQLTRRQHTHTHSHTHIHIAHTQHSHIHTIY